MPGRLRKSPHLNHQASGCAPLIFSALGMVVRCETSSVLAQQLLRGGVVMALRLEHQVLPSLVLLFSFALAFSFCIGRCSILTNWPLAVCAVGYGPHTLVMNQFKSPRCQCLSQTLSLLRYLNEAELPTQARLGAVDLLSSLLLDQASHPISFDPLSSPLPGCVFSVCMSRGFISPALGGSGTTSSLPSEKPSSSILPIPIISSSILSSQSYPPNTTIPILSSQHDISTRVSSSNTFRSSLVTLGVPFTFRRWGRPSNISLS